MKEDYVLKKIEALMKQRGWTFNKLAKKAQIPTTVLPNARARNNVPTIPTILAICRAFEISLAQFFRTEEDAIFTEKEQRLIDLFGLLNEADKDIILKLVAYLYEKNRLQGA